MPVNNNEFLTVEQVANLLQVHWQTVLNYIRGGKLKAMRLGKGYRINRQDLIKFIKSQTI